MTTSIYAPEMARLVDVKQMTELEKLFTIELPDGRSLGHEPGQFVMTSILGVGEAPISITSSPSRSNGTFQMCVRQIGDVTNALHALKPGDTVGIRGPFGNPFPIDDMRGKDLFFIPGGIGLPPLRSLINQALDERDSFGRVIIAYGARRPAELLFVDELDEWVARDDVECHLTVDGPGKMVRDGVEKEWDGHVGVVTTLFSSIDIDASNTVAVTVGPPIMYRFVIMELLGKDVPEDSIYLSLERRMKCGVGKCGHCQINSLYCCQDGPVFRYDQIKGVQEAL